MTAIDHSPLIGFRPGLDIPSVSTNEDDLGELSTETVQKLTDMAKQLLAKFFEKMPHAALRVTQGSLVELAAFVTEQVPFFWQVQGVTTLPKQLAALHYYFKPETYKTENNLNELKRQVDCKLTTVLLAFAIQEYAQVLHQIVDVDLITSGKAPHPFLIIQFKPEKDGDIVHYLKFNMMNRRNTEMSLAKNKKLPHYQYREYFVSYAIIKVLSKEKYAAYDNAPYKHLPLNVTGISQLDRQFLNS